ncbi:MAG: hypothetical protein RL110_1364, partial [Bacteroidota bacterium]
FPITMMAMTTTAMTINIDFYCIRPRFLKTDFGTKLSYCSFTLTLNWESVLKV